MDNVTEQIIIKAPLGICVLNKEGIIEVVNEKFLEVVGGPQPEGVVGLSIFKLPLIQELLSGQIKSAQQGNSFDIETKIDLKDKDSVRFYRFWGRPVFGQNQTVPEGVILFIDDISERKRLESDMQGYMAKLNLEQSRLLASINSLTLGFIIVDYKNNILIKNNAIDRILDLKGLEGNVLLKGDIAGIFDHLKDGFDLEGKSEQCRQEKKAVDVKDIQFGAKFLHIFIAPIMLSPVEEAIGVVILIEDITEAKVLERSRDEFFSLASHELRTPLTAIRGNSALIKQFYGEKLKDKELNEMIEDIHSASTRLIDIVNDFLNMSRLEQGRFLYKNESFDLDELAKEVVKELQAVAIERKLDLVFSDPKGSIPKVFADRDRCKQVLINLVGNGLKYTDRGKVAVSLDVKDTFVKVLVSDTGRGIPLSSQSLLFRKFQQAGESILTRDVTRGTGLGLYISKLMVEGMGGEIRLEKSQPGQGSTFSFSLPIAKTEE